MKTFRYLSGKQWYLQHNCVGYTVVSIEPAICNLCDALHEWTTSLLWQPPEVYVLVYLLWTCHTSLIFTVVFLLPRKPIETIITNFLNVYHCMILHTWTNITKLHLLGVIQIQNPLIATWNIKHITTYLWTNLVKKIMDVVLSDKQMDSSLLVTSNFNRKDTCIIFAHSQREALDGTIKYTWRIWLSHG